MHSRIKRVEIDGKSYVGSSTVKEIRYSDGGVQFIDFNDKVFKKVFGKNVTVEYHQKLIEVSDGLIAAGSRVFYKGSRYTIRGLNYVGNVIIMDESSFHKKEYSVNPDELCYNNYDDDKVAIDVDDVIAGFYPAACKLCNIKLKENVDIWDCDGHAGFIKHYWNLIKDAPFFWLSLPKIMDPHYVEKIADYYMSALPSHLAEERYAWLVEKGFPELPLIITDEKYKKCKELGINVLIDDKEDTIKPFKEDKDMLGIWYKPPYMIDKGQDADSPEDIIELINNFHGE